MCPFFDHCVFKWIPEKVRYVLRCCVAGKDDEYDLQAEKAHSLSTFAEVSSLQKRTIVEILSNSSTTNARDRLYST